MCTGRPTTCECKETFFFLGGGGGGGGADLPLPAYFRNKGGGDALIQTMDISYLSKGLFSYCVVFFVTVGVNVVTYAAQASTVHGHCSRRAPSPSGQTG